MMLITPWVNAALDHAAIAAAEPMDPMLGVTGLREAGRLHAGPLGAEHPWVSALRADLRGLPAMQVLAGPHAMLHHDSLEFAIRVRAAGCSVDPQVSPGMIHAWPLLPLPEGRWAHELISRFLKAGFFKGEHGFVSESARIRY